MSERYYFTDEAGKILGPAALDDIKTYIDTGHIGPTAQICSVDETDWRPFYQVVNEGHTAQAATVPSNLSVEQPQDTVALETPPIKQQGLTLNALLQDLRNKVVLLQTMDGKQAERVSIEQVGQDLITCLLVVDNTLVHIPISRLFRIVELIDTGETLVEIR